MLCTTRKLVQVFRLLRLQLLPLELALQQPLLWRALWRMWQEVALWPILMPTLLLWV